MKMISSEKTAMLQAAMLRCMGENWPKAVDDYQALDDIFPGDPYILESLARVQQKLGMSEACARNLAKAVQGYRDAGLLRKASLLEARLLKLPVAV